MDTRKMTLPAHLKSEAEELRAASSVDNPITEMQARPLVKSTAIWLMKNGTINKEDSPLVVDKAGKLLHELLPLHFCQVPKGDARNRFRVAHLLLRAKSCVA